MQLQTIQQKIYEIRGHKVMLDFDLAEMYEVETRVLNQAVKRNIDRFPKDFMFQLNAKELENNSSQFVMSSRKHRGKVYLPFAFTEHGVTMLASILKSEKAIRMNIAIVKAFIALRQITLNYGEIATKISRLEKKYNKRFSDIYKALDLLFEEKQGREEWEERERIGFKK